MGFFSWKTQDTNQSIPNKYSNRKTFRVYMIDNKGHKWVEDDYEGYGRFGSKDFYELLAEMNGVTSNLTGEAYTDYMRGKGIDLAFKNNPSGVATKGVFFPNLIIDTDRWSYEKTGPDSDENQGYFYDGDEDEDEQYENDYDEEYEYAKGGKTANIKDYLQNLESDQIFDLCNDFYYDDEEWHEIKNDLDKDDLIQWAHDYCKKNKISLKDLKDVLGDREDEIADMKTILQSNLIPYLDVAYKNSGVINLRVYNKDSFAFYNKNDNCKVTITYNDDSKSVIMYQEWDNGNMDDDEVSLLTFENYLSNAKMAEGGMIKLRDQYKLIDQSLSAPLRNGRGLMLLRKGDVIKVTKLIADNNPGFVVANFEGDSILISKENLENGNKFEKTMEYGDYMADGGNLNAKYIAYIEESRRPGGSDKSIKKTYNLDVEDRTSDGFYLTGAKEDIEDFINDYSINFAEIKLVVNNEEYAKGGETKNSQMTPFQRANQIAEDHFGEFGLATLEHDDFVKVIKMAKANKLAREKGKSSFMLLEESDMETILNDNPDLLKDNYADGGMMNQRQMISSMKDLKAYSKKAYESLIELWANLSRGTTANAQRNLSRDMGYRFMIFADGNNIEFKDTHSGDKFLWDGEKWKMQMADWKMKMAGGDYMAKGGKTSDIYILGSNYEIQRPGIDDDDLAKALKKYKVQMYFIDSEGWVELIGEKNNIENLLKDPNVWSISSNELDELFLSKMKKYKGKLETNYNPSKYMKQYYEDLYSDEDYAKGGSTSKYNVGDTVVYYNREGKITKISKTKGVYVEYLDGGFDDDDPGGEWLDQDDEDLYTLGDVEDLDAEMEKLVDEHTKEAKKNRVKITNLGWSQGDNFIVSKTTERKDGSDVLTSEISNGVVTHDWDSYKRGGKLKTNPAKFRDKVNAITKKLAGTKVPKKYKKDYGATYDKKEANTAAKRIAGAKLAEVRAKLAKKKK